MPDHTPSRFNMKLCRWSIPFEYICFQDTFQDHARLWGSWLFVLFFYSSSYYYFFIPHKVLKFHRNGPLCTVLPPMQLEKMKTLAYSDIHIRWGPYVSLNGNSASLGPKFDGSCANNGTKMKNGTFGLCEGNVKDRPYHVRPYPNNGQFSPDMWKLPVMCSNQKSTLGVECRSA